MHIKKKILWLAIAVAVVAGVVAVAILWNSAHQAPPQIITLANGDQYQFAGVTYSTKNVPPVFAARLQSVLPKNIANWSRKYLRTDVSQFNVGEKSDSPRLFVWFRRLGTNGPYAFTNFNARLADESGVEAGASTYPAFARGIAWSYAEFDVIPKRSRTLQCTLYPFFVNTTPYTPVGQVTFANPAYGHFPQWQPEPIPTAKTNGDLEVRLDDLETGHQANAATIPKPNGTRGVPLKRALRGQDALTEIDVTPNPLGGSNELWMFHNIELSDATGNVFRESSLDQNLMYYNEVPPKPSQRPPARGYSEVLRTTLWPDENAWRVKFEFKRALGFSSNELVTFANIPIPAMGATNNFHIVKTVGGGQIVFTQFVRKADMTNFIGGAPIDYLSRVRFELPNRPAGVAFDIQNVTTDKGKPEGYGLAFVDSAYLFSFRTIPSNAQTVDVTWLVQKTRTVEFLVKPPKPD